MFTQQKHYTAQSNNQILSEHLEHSLRVFHFHILVRVYSMKKRVFPMLPNNNSVLRPHCTLSLREQLD